MTTLVMEKSANKKIWIRKEELAIWITKGMKSEIKIAKNMALNNNSIKEFWDWFAEHNSELAAASVSDSLILGLEHRLFKIRQLDWELGPGQTKPNFFALSPRGNPELLQITRAIVSEAPELKDWEYYPAKPARDWKLVFNLEVDGKPIRVDGKCWEVRVAETADGRFDLIFKPDASIDVSKEYLNWAAVIIADGELGEERRMNCVRDIIVVKYWNSSAIGTIRKLKLGFLAKAVARGKRAYSG